jgi:N-acetylmuramic acid 6-phosphate etherase
MKAGTAQKMALNMISTVAMIRLGYVKGNRMTNMKAANEKLQDRSLRILMEETGVDESRAASLIKEAGGDLRVALVIAKSNASRQAAENALMESQFVVERAIEKIGSSAS